jgi:hypothetical protein
MATTAHGIEIVPVFGGFLRRMENGVAVEVVAAADRPTRYYIAIGQAGFNSPANNRNGYKTDAAAAAASLRYSKR